MKDFLHPDELRMVVKAHLATLPRCHTARCLAQDNPATWEILLAGQWHPRCDACIEMWRVYEMRELATAVTTRRFQAMLVRAAGGRRGIYIASKTAHGARWRALRAEGVPIRSTWLDLLDLDQRTPGQGLSLSGLWQGCIDEASSVAALVLYAEPREVLKGAYVEMGAALTAGVPVFSVAPSHHHASCFRHKGVRRCASLDEALRHAVPYLVGEERAALGAWCARQCPL
jgi:hypothetical protein